MSGYKLVKHHHTGKALWQCFTSRQKARLAKVTWPHHHQHHHQWHRFLSVRLTRAGIIDRISKPVRSDERKKIGINLRIKIDHEKLLTSFDLFSVKNSTNQFFWVSSQPTTFFGFDRFQQKEAIFDIFSQYLKFLNSLGSFFTHLQITHSQKH